MGIIIRRLVWEPKNIKHISRHNIIPEEIEEMRTGFKLIRATYNKRLILIGETERAE